ncbi:MAG: M50 family metallopeptidase [Clostridia bacterium]|nr:M50 family metallopeptidase [Clostridia bacterium]
MRIGKFFVGFDFILLIAVFYVIDSDGLFFLALIAATVHELGHIVAIKLCKGKIDNIYLGSFGARIQMKLYPILSYKREIIIALAGPLAGAIFGLLSSFMGNYTIAGFSMILTLFNLIPALPLDGGSVIKYLSLLFLDELWQQRISRALNAMSALGIVALGVFVTVNYSMSPSLLIFCTFTSTNFLKEFFE